MHEWLPVGHMVGHITGVSDCPGCPKNDEDISQVLSCPNQAMVDKLVIDEMWEFLSKLMTERARKDASLSGTSSLSYTEGTSKAALKRKPSTTSEPSPLVVQYKSFLKKKAEGLGGRLPTVDENRQFYKEFQEHMRSVNAAKKKKALEDKDWNPKKKIDRKKSGTGKQSYNFKSKINQF